MKEAIKYNAKVLPYKSFSVFNDIEVQKSIIALWNKNLSIEQIAKRLRSSESAIAHATRNLKRDRIDKRYIDVFVARCLIVEHGISNKNVARILGVHVNSLSRAMRLNKQYTEDNYETWKRAHTKWRLSLRTKDYGRQLLR
jgi:hypothetical protein